MSGMWKKKEVETEIARLNAEMMKNAKKANEEWRGILEWKALREQEIEAARIQRAAEKIGGLKKKLGNHGEERR